MLLRPQPVGDLLKAWRQRRRYSQLALALEAEISQRHLSFVESGRSAPSREMILRLAEHLDIPLRERNALLVAAGYAPIYQQHALEHPALAHARRAVLQILKGHEPYPALAVDRHWTMVLSNAAVAPLLTDVDPTLLQPPVNVMRLSLHPKGLGPRIANVAEWRSHLIDRLQRQYRLTADRQTEALLREISAYPVGAGEADPKAATHDDHAAILVPLKLRTANGMLSFFSASTVFGTPLEITLSELALEAFYPADDATVRALTGPRT